MKHSLLLSALAAAAALLFSSCASPYYAGPNGQMGSVLGGVLGAAAGAGIGENKGRELEGAAIGGVIGALAGAAAGSSQDNAAYAQQLPRVQTTTYPSYYRSSPTISYGNTYYADPYRYASSHPRYLTYHSPIRLGLNYSSHRSHSHRSHGHRGHSSYGSHRGYSNSRYCR